MSDKNMYEAIKDIKYWDYYKKGDDSQIFDDFSNLDTHQKFIAKYLYRGEKTNIVNNFDNLKKITF